MKFTNYLKGIDNVSIYPLISLIIFTAVFVGITIYTFSSDKEKMKNQANIPLN